MILTATVTVSRSDPEAAVAADLIATGGTVRSAQGLSGKGLTGSGLSGREPSGKGLSATGVSGPALTAKWDGRKRDSANKKDSAKWEYPLRSSTGSGLGCSRSVLLGYSFGRRRSSSRPRFCGDVRGRRTRRVSVLQVRLAVVLRKNEWRRRGANGLLLGWCRHRAAEFAQNLNRHIARRSLEQICLGEVDELLEGHPPILRTHTCRTLLLYARAHRQPNLRNRYSSAALHAPRLHPSC